MHAPTQSPATPWSENQPRPRDLPRPPGSRTLGTQPHGGIPPSPFASLFSQNQSVSSARRVSTQRGVRHKPYPNARETTPIRSFAIAQVVPSVFELVFVPYPPQPAVVVDFLDNPDSFKLTQQNMFPFFSVLQQNGLSRTITLNDHGPLTVRQQIHEHVHQLMSDKHLSFSNITFPNSLSENEEAPWQMIRGGNKVASGQLLKWADLLPHQMRTIAQILPTIRKVRSPLCTHDIILIAGSSRINGPIHPSSTEAHPCYASRIFYNIYPPPDNSIDGCHCFETCPPVPPNITPLDLHYVRPGQVPAPVSSTSRSSASMVPRALDLSAVVQNPFQAVAHMTPQSQVYDVHDSDDEQQLLLSESRFSNDATPPPNSPWQLSPLYTFSLPGDDLQPVTLPRLPERSPSPTPLRQHQISMIRSSSVHASTPIHPSTSSPSLPLAPIISAPNCAQSRNEPRATIRWDRHSSPADWRDKLKATRVGPKVYGVMISSDTEADAAAALIESLIHYHLGEDPTSLPDIHKFSYDDLATGDKSISVGTSVGQGVAVGVFRHAIQLLVKNRSEWKSHDSQSYTWNIRSAIRSTPVRLAHAKAAGSLLALGMIWYQTTSPPCSFWMTALATSGFSALRDIDYLRSVDGNLARSLEAWPLDFSLPLDLTIGSRISEVLANIGVSVSEVQDTKEEREQYTDEIYAQALFQGSAKELVDNVDIQAFITAFNVPITPDLRLIDTLGSTPKNFVKLFHGQHLHSAAQLITALEFQPAPNHPNFTSDDAAVFSVKLARYLRGTGHPTHPNLAQIISPAMRQEVAGNPTYRSRRFLICATGSEILPNRRWTITASSHVQFVSELGESYRHNMPENPPEGWEPTWPPLVFHTCAEQVDVPISNDLLKMLKCEDPGSDDIASEFDAWIHPILQQPSLGSEEWNIL